MQRTTRRADFVAEVTAQVLVSPQLNGMLEDRFELELDLGEVEETRRPVWLELDEQVDIARRPEVITQGRAVQGEPPDPVPPRDIGESGIVDAHARP